MAVDQLRNLNLFREMLSTSNNSINNPMINHIIAGGYSDNNNNLMLNGDSLRILNPVYNLNDVVFAGKLPPPVKDDSGVSFNNSHVVLPPSRKRPREPMVLPSAIVSGGRSVDVRKRSNGFSFLGEDLSLQIMQQKLELDLVVSQHMEKMRIEIEERQKHHQGRIMAVIENEMSKQMREKDDQISKLIKMNMELEEKAKTLHLQSQIWRDMANTNEATANALRSNLDQILHQVRQNDAVRDSAEDAGSCCGSNGDEEEEAESGEQNVEGKRWVYRGKKEELDQWNSSDEKRCKKCGEGERSVLVLPCRHLCLCRVCGPSVNACPVCDSVKNASIHVNLS